MRKRLTGSVAALALLAGTTFPLAPATSASAAAAGGALGGDGPIELSAAQLDQVTAAGPLPIGLGVAALSLALYQFANTAADVASRNYIEFDDDGNVILDSAQRFWTEDAVQLGQSGLRVAGSARGPGGAPDVSLVPFRLLAFFGLTPSDAIEASVATGGAEAANGSPAQPTTPQVNDNTPTTNPSSNGTQTNATRPTRGTIVIQITEF